MRLSHAILVSDTKHKTKNRAAKTLHDCVLYVRLEVFEDACALDPRPKEAESAPNAASNFFGLCMRVKKGDGDWKSEAASLLLFDFLDDDFVVPTAGAPTVP